MSYETQYIQDNTLPIGIPYFISRVNGRLDILLDNPNRMNPKAVSISVHVDDGLVTAEITKGGNIVSHTNLFDVRELDLDTEEDEDTTPDDQELSVSL